RVRTATDALDDLPDAGRLLRTARGLEQQLDNLERLARPTKRDFGVFSGLIACAMFAPLLATVAIVNSVFSLDIGGTLIIETCVVLALVAGFGLTAIRFRTFLPWSQ